MSANALVSPIVLRRGREAYLQAEVQHEQRSSFALVRQGNARGERRRRTADRRVSSEAEAKAAIERVRNKRGFAEFQDGFQISSYVLDHDHWSDGFTIE